MKSHRSMLYTTGFVFVIAFVVIYAAKKTTVFNPTPSNALNSGGLTETTGPEASPLQNSNSKTTNPENGSENSPQNLNESTPTTQDYSSSPSSQNMAVNPNTGRPENNSEAARIQQIEIQKTKELNEKNVKLIHEQMKKEEIASLQTSIVNDEKLLKEIEAQGTGADDYRYIENNLKKRRARLKELTQK